MTKLALFGIALWSMVASADAIVANNKQTRTIDCAKDPTVLIAGDGNTITLKGKCKLVRLPGDHNTVTAESATALALDGDNNTVRIAAVDAISVNGDHNTVT